MIAPGNLLPGAPGNGIRPVRVRYDLVLDLIELRSRLGTYFVTQLSCFEPILPFPPGRDSLWRGSWQ